MSYEDDASSRVKKNNPLTPKPDNSWMKSLPKVDGMPRFRPAPQPPPEAALCGAHCEHDATFYRLNSDPRAADENSLGPMCWHEDLDGFCGHRCTFPAPVESYPAGWVYEDELGAEVTREIYDKWFCLSRVIDGVRMGPSPDTLVEAPAVAETPLTVEAALVELRELFPGEMNLGIDRSGGGRWAYRKARSH